MGKGFQMFANTEYLCLRYFPYGRDWSAILSSLPGEDNIVYANGTKREDVNTEISMRMIRQATNILQENCVKKANTFIHDRRNISHFVGICNYSMKWDIMNLKQFRPVEHYSETKIHPNEFGCVEDVCFITQMNALGPVEQFPQTKPKIFIFPVLILGIPYSGHEVIIRGKDIRHFHFVRLEAAVNIASSPSLDDVHMVERQTMLFDRRMAELMGVCERRFVFGIET